MEEDPRFLPFKTSLLKRSTIQKEMEMLKNAVDEAQEIINFEQAHNSEILFAIELVEQFLRKKKRVCYGGTAINALLPKKLKFYDEEVDLPDYDFFTPDPETDVKELVAMLRKAGFTDVIQRIGMHEGTFKILVNFVPIADVSKLDTELYSVIYKRSIIKDGIHYTDPDFLRMSMYLELSRPRGQVGRWEKVFERLVLLNTAFPVKGCKQSLQKITGNVHVPTVIRKVLLDYVLDNNRVLIGGEVVALYDWVLQKRYKKNPSIQWFLHKNGTIVFYSPEAVRDGLQLKEALGSEAIHVETVRGKEELVPEQVVLTFKGMPLAVIVQETACHAYNEISLKEGRKLRIGTLETLLTLYYSLYLFSDKETSSLDYSLKCLTQKLVEMGTAFLKLGDNAPFPTFSIECSGYQKGYATLLKEKYVRIKKEKKKQQTQKSQKSSSTQTRRVNSELRKNST
jgi:hypothetical protein